MAANSDTKRKNDFWIGEVILILGIVATAVLWFWLRGNRTNQVMALWVTLPATAFFFTLWWTFFSGLKWSVRGTGLGVLAAAAGLFFGLFRLDGFSGDFVPQIAPRWETTAEDRAEEYWETVAVNTTIPAVKGEADAGAALVVGEEDWPEFRGAERDGIVRGVEIRRDWENQPELLWKHPVGKGWSSFAVVDRFAFTLERRGESDVLVCYDVEDGGHVWRAEIPGPSFASPQGGPGPMSTPTVFDSRVYSLGGAGMLTCHKAADGELLWETNILKDAGGAENLEWGMSASPLVYEQFVVVNPGGTGGNSVVAYDRLTGKKIWSAGSQPAGYSSPSLATLEGVQQVLVFHGTGISGHDPQTGEELWKFTDWKNSPMVNAAQPIVRDEKYVFISSGYGLGCSLLEVTQNGDGWSVKQNWDNQNLGMKFSSGVYRDGYVYGLDEQILVCVDYMTGKRLWRKRGNFGYGQLILVEDLLLIVTEKTGEVVLHEAKPQGARELGRFPAIEGITWNHPVLHRGLLLVRNGEEAACFDLRPASAVARAETGRSSDAVAVDSGGEAVKTAQSQD